MSGSGYQFNPDLPELNESIVLANAYIQKYRGILEDFAQDKKTFDKALSSPVSIKAADLGKTSYAKASFNIPTKSIEINLNSRYIDRLKFLMPKKNLRIYSQEWTFLVFFFAVVLLHQYCHYIVRFKNWSRITPRRCRTYRGKLLDAGHSLEIIIFKGILRLVQSDTSDRYTGIVLEVYDPELTFHKTNIETLKNIVDSKYPEGKLYEGDVPEEYIPDEKSKEHILDSVEDLDENEPVLDVPVIEYDTDTDARSLTLDSKHHTIIRFPDHCCVKFD
jgi:hypothetical protein